MYGRKKVKGFNRDGWLNIYADMITLILVFFILLYSISVIDQEKYQMLVKAFTKDPETLEKIRLLETEKKEEVGKPDPAQTGIKGDDIFDIENLEDLYIHLKNYISENELEESVQVQKGKDAVFIRFMSTLFFEADKADLKNGGKEILDYVGEAMAHVEPIVKLIRIDGHTAEAAPGTSKVDDRSLSTDRANKVLKHLEKHFVKDPAKLIAVGYGMFRPVAPNDIEENRAKNRRVEILITKSDSIKEQLDEIYEEMQEKR